MRTVALVFIASLAVGGSAFAAERAQECSSPIEKIKAKLPAGTHFDVLTPGAFHFAQGMFVATPPVSGDLPPGDGATLVTRNGEDVAMLLWTRGKNVCVPFPIPMALAKVIQGMKTGKDETSGPQPGDVHL